MQRLRCITNIIKFVALQQPNYVNFQQQMSFSYIQKLPLIRNIVAPLTPVMNQTCSFKIKGHVRRRCKSCYIVVRDERIYNICPKFPRHKQMSMKPKPLTTYILTHATQSKVRPW